MVQLFEALLAEKTPSAVYEFLIQNSQEFREFVEDTNKEKIQI